MQLQIGHQNAIDKLRKKELKRYTTKRKNALNNTLRSINGETNHRPISAKRTIKKCFDSEWRPKNKFWFRKKMSRDQHLTNNEISG